MGRLCSIDRTEAGEKEEKMTPEHVHHLATVWYVVFGAGGQFVFSALVSSMPPYNGSNYLMKWLYAFLHLLAANWDKVHIPGSAGDIAATNGK